MNEELQKQLVSYLPDLKDALSKGVTYGGELYERAVKYYIVKDVVSTGICLIIFIASQIFARKIYKYLKKEDELEGDGYLVVFAVYAISCLTLIPVIYGLFDLIQLHYIPEIYIIKQLQTL